MSKQLKIAVCGCSRVLVNCPVSKIEEIGKEIALLGHILLTGGCSGYPHEAAKAAFKHKGKVIAYSPAKDLKEHIENYLFPTDFFSEIVFTGKGIPDRNLELVRAADAVIIVDGKVGTLNEFTIAFHYGKPIGVLLTKDCLGELLKPLAERIDKKGEKDKIIYEEDGKKIVRLLGS
jgi:uncharacterized protein (TIGR00725 family)